jgi:hypothetical protein
LRFKLKEEVIKKNQTSHAGIYCVVSHPENVITLTPQVEKSVPQLLCHVIKVVNLQP